jgi:glycosyltransferase involved in cell wall biosynthesis
MKIIIISPAFPLRGGIAASAERLAQELQNTGHEVIIYSFSLQYPNFLFPGKTQFSDDAAPTDLNIKTVINSVNPFNWIKVGFQLLKDSPDQIICRFWMPFFGPSLGTILMILKWFSSKKVKITALVDNIIPHEKRFGDRFLASYFVGSCDDFVVMSNSVADELRTFTKTKDIRYAPHPIYDNYGTEIVQKEAKAQLNLPGNAHILLFFGFIRAYKGLDLLLEALGKVSSENLHLVVAGERYEDWKPYQDIIERLDLAQKVHLFPDFIPSEDVKYYFSAADLVVQPYKSATQSGISQIAYHFEKPMIVTNVGGLSEIVKNGVSGYLVEPNSDEIALAIDDFFKKNKDWQAGIREEKLQFSWRNLVDSLIG